MKIITTIGYEGASPDAFDDALAAAGVEIVVDVRAVALSRRPGFSKKVLSDRLQSHGLEYIHLRSLGDPKAGREAARSGNMILFRQIFSKHLESTAAQFDLEELQMIAADRRVALLCYEADAAGCHRTIVANQVAKAKNFAILHLNVKPGGTAIGGRARRDDHSCEGLAAA